MTTAVVGLGAMGSRIARRLIAAGHQLVIWNRSPAKLGPLLELGAIAAATPAEAAMRADVLITVVADPEALRAVSDGSHGIVAGADSSLTVIEMSTVGPDAVAELSRKLPARVALLDAPVLGGLAEAEAGRLTIFAGGPDQAIAAARPLLDQLGTVRHLGPLGSGAAAKLVANATLFGSVALVGEAIALGRRLGLPDETTYDVLATTPLAAQAERRRPAIAETDYPRRFALSLARKDADLIRTAARRGRHDLQLLEATGRWLNEAEEAGWGQHDYTAMLARIVGREGPAETAKADTLPAARSMLAAGSEMAKAMGAQPSELTRLLADTGPVEAAAAGLAGRRIFVIGTGSSFHAANQGAHLLRLAGADARAVAAADSVLWGPAPTRGDALVVLSHRGTKRYTSQALARARQAGVLAFSIGGVGSRADIETVAQERSGTFTVSHLAALLRLAQLARTLGADLDLEAVPEAVGAVLAGPRPGVELPARGLDFVGAGPNQWTASEGALKVREAAHVFTSAYAVEQLLHGPGFALERRDGLICLDGGGYGSERLAELSAAIESRGTRVHRFAATALGEPLSIFPLTVIVQRVALDFATLRGTDPDNVAPPIWKSMEL